MEMIGFGERLVFSSTPGTKRVGPFAYLRRKLYLRRHAKGVLEKHRRIADLLVQRLLVDGLEERIQIEDIEALCATEKTPKGRSPMLFRKIIILNMTVLREG